MSGWLSRVRKALVAGFGAGLGAGIAVIAHTLSAGESVTAETIGAAVGALVTVGGPVGWATWRIPNAAASPAPRHR